ncbi:MAG: 4-alpha-glucanotransferase [Candidatus Cloacimonetes bacterium]|nr:4-alpha-glucanotransferase [Candidatus Cloacimonadota bacterium]
MAEKFQRSSGILLHITSLPNRFGIGSMGAEAEEFVNFLAKSGQKLWQICPLGPTGYGDSPYQVYSSFAGNPLLIDLDSLVQNHLLNKSDLEPAPEFNAQYVEYEKVCRFKDKMFRLAYDKFKKKIPQRFKVFLVNNAFWLEDYALFMALKGADNGKSWLQWQPELKLRDKKALAEKKSELTDEIRYQQFLQFIFCQQWQKLKEYTNEKGIKIIGDIPIYPALDSADVWAFPQYYQFDKEHNPSAVSGCPPDDFSPTGQLWGNPLYNWEKLESDEYSWWVARFAYMLEMVDIIRIDHFLGFEHYWSVPFGSPTAENGVWKPGPGHKLFATVEKELGNLPLIAEDLGAITPAVERLRDDFNFPGMKILQFAFYDDDDNPYLPHNFTTNCVVYTGTHDNETSVGWYHNLPDHIKNNVRNYLSFLKFTDWEVGWKLIEAALDSVAVLAIAPLQDYIGLDNRARFNIPGTVGENWRWRYMPGVLTPQMAEAILRMVRKSKRL